MVRIPQVHCNVNVLHLTSFTEPRELCEVPFDVCMYTGPCSGDTFVIFGAESFLRLQMGWLPPGWLNFLTFFIFFFLGVFSGPAMILLTSHYWSDNTKMRSWFDLPKWNYEINLLNSVLLRNLTLITYWHNNLLCEIKLTD